MAKAGEPFRFKPGQSGNPNGRPKRKSLRLLLREADEHIADELIRCMRSEDIEQALQAILLYARFRHAKEWRAGEVQATQISSASVTVTEPDITAEQRRAVIRYVSEQLTPKEVEGGAGQPQIASGKAAESARGQLAADKVRDSVPGSGVALPPTSLAFGNWK